MDTSGTRRLCLFCEKWASGGIESFLFNLLTHMELDGLEVDLVAAQLCESVFTQRLQALGVRFVELTGDPRRLRENSRRFRALLRQRHYDVAHLNLFQALSLSYAKLAAEAGVPVRVVHSHNAALRKSLGRPLKLALHRWGRKRYGKYATHRWACSAPAAEFMFGPDAGYRFIPNGIETARFRFDPAGRDEARRELGVEEGTLVLGNVGRLCEQKNQSFLLEVLARLRQDRPDSLLLLVGQGEDRPALEEKAKSLGLEGAVLFYGATGRVEPLYWAMDVFLLPSRFEGLPVSLVEAQAAGLPALCSPAVTGEAALARVDFLPLEPPLWAQAIVNGKTTDRTAGAGTVAAAGFDISDAARLVTESYKGA